MYIENGEKYFENRKEQLEYIKVFNFIMSFYKNKEDLKIFLNNINYLKNSDDDKAYGCFKKDIKTVLYLFTLEYPNLDYLYNEYKIKKENNIISFVLRDIYINLIENCRKIRLIK